MAKVAVDTSKILQTNVANLDPEEIKQLMISTAEEAQEEGGQVPKERG